MAGGTDGASGSANRHVIVKVCGITRVEDGLFALGAGADWLGFIRWPGSPRYRASDSCAETLREIRARAPLSFEAVGVYVDASAEEIEREVEQMGFDRAQLHGEEGTDFIAALPIPVIKVIKIAGPESVGLAAEYPETLILTDTSHPRLMGGTGKSYDAGILEDLVRQRPVIVAGGLTPENVGGVVRDLAPFGVDVSSGVERTPGLKDADKVEAFIRAVRESES